MGAAHGWERPNWFSDRSGCSAVHSFRRSSWFGAVARECEAVTARVALADLSVFSKFKISGPGTTDFLATLGANREPRPGRLGMIHALTPAGGVLSEFTVARLTETHAYLTSAAAAEEIDFDLLRDHASAHNVTLENRTEALGVIGVMGPHSRDLLAPLTGADGLDAFPWLTVQEIEVAGVPARAMRVSYIGELGWELHVARDSTAELFLALEEAGKPLGVGLYGAFAANSMRLEKGYRGWGGDLTTERTPLEAGLDPFVRSEGRKFIGRDAMLAREQDTPWRMVLLEIETGEIDPFYSHSVIQGEHIVGIVTTGAHGHRTGKTLALAYLRDPDALSDLSVHILGIDHKAQILEQPPFDPDNLRLKA